MNKTNYFLGTKATFKGCGVPKRKPDYISYNRDGKVSSRYWYTKDGVYRESDHWSIIFSERKINGKHYNGELKDPIPFDDDYRITELVGYYTFSPPIDYICECGKIRTCYWRLKTTKPIITKTLCGFCKWTRFSKNN